ncbi:MAG TPA: hypothetical protein VFY24_14710, partial [Azospira sp.]|nr:hypothetical protein [Azospira sp.]
MNGRRARRNRWRPAALALLALLVLAGCAGNVAHRQGMEMFALGQQEAGLAKLEQATVEAPDNPVYRQAYRN